MELRRHELLYRAAAVLSYSLVVLSGCGGGSGGSDEPKPALSVSPASISLSATLGGESDSETFQVSNSGSGTLSFQVNSDSDLLAVSPASGSATRQTGSEVTVELMCESPGSFSASISVTGGNSTRTVSVMAECERPTIELAIEGLSPALGEGEPSQAAESSFRWKASSTWAEQPALDYSIAADREDVTITPSSGNVEMDVAEETKLTANCPDQARFDAEITVQVDGQELDVPWSVRCRAGDARFLSFEMFQGPMTWHSNVTTGESIFPVGRVAGRNTTLAVTIGHESPTVPSMAATIRETEGEILDDSPDPLLETTQATGNGLWETEYVYDITAHYENGNQMNFSIDRDRALDETNEENNRRRVTFGGSWRLPVFRIAFIPIRTQLGDPDFEAEEFMDRIYDLMPIGRYEMRTGDTLDLSSRAVDHQVAIDAVRRHWNRRGRRGEFFYGVYVREAEAEYCGSGQTPGYVAVGGADCSLTTPPHEIGHNLSLGHAPSDCQAGEDIINVDPDYPYSDGGIGPNRGWVISENRFAEPEGVYDIMSYCNPRFVSDYQYDKALDYRIRIARQSGLTPGLAIQSIDPGQPMPVLAEATEPQSGPSIALTGKVDEWGAWVLMHVDRSEMPPRSPPASATHTLTLQDSRRREIHRESLLLSDISHSQEKAWAARIPFPQQTPAYLVIYDELDVPVLVERIDPQTFYNPPPATNGELQRRH